MSGDRISDNIDDTIDGLADAGFAGGGAHGTEAGRCVGGRLEAPLFGPDQAESFAVAGAQPSARWRRHSREHRLPQVVDVSQPEGVTDLVEVQIPPTAIGSDPGPPHVQVARQVHRPPHHIGCEVPRMDEVPVVAEAGIAL
jgi:hypothetical protein